MSGGPGSLVGAVAHAALLLGPPLAWVGPAAVAPGRAALLVAGALALARSELPAAGSGPAPLGVSAADRAHRIATVVSALGMLALVWACLATAPRAGVGPAQLGVGLSLVAGGAGLRAAAARALGAGFGAAPSSTRELRSDGVYAWLRHPSELGLMGAALGLVILAGSPVAAGVLLWVLLPASAVRVGLEARVLGLP